MFWLFLSVVLFSWEWFNRSLRTLAVTVAVTLTAFVSMMGASFSQTMSFFIVETMLNLCLVEIWMSLAYAGAPRHEEEVQEAQEAAPATVKVVRWNPDDTAIVLYNGKEISAEKESPFIRESNMVDIVKHNGHWLIVKAR